MLKVPYFKKGNLSPVGLFYTGDEPIGNVKEFLEGLVTVQDESGQMVAEIMDPKENCSILDMCAAPGSKTFHMASKINNKGKIIAIDLYEHRIQLLKNQIKRLGATSVIPEMIDMIQDILKKGLAYTTPEGNVYFELGKVPGYGKLSGRKIEESLSGERITIADDKKNPEDCALWKTASGGHVMKWNSPWGVGYPGWHIECSAISKKFLGNTFDIHGGGLDNVFPHHETEIAQSEIANGAPFVNYFMHNNLVTVNGTKMGKSLGNFVTLEQLFETFDPMVVRYFILQFHYRKPVDFSMEAIKASEDQYKKIAENMSNIKKLANGEFANIENADLISVKENFENAMSDDFNTPLAIAELIRFSKIAGAIVKNNDETLAKQANILVKMVEDVLGFEFKFDIIKEESKDNNAELLNLIADVREKLRLNKNYEMSDYIRNELNKLDITISDKKL
jgi:cysteinyl-tRNA synthetase